MRECPRLTEAAAVLERSDVGKSAETVTASAPPPTPVPNEPNSAFKRNGTAALAENSDSTEVPFVQVVDPALPAMSAESTPGTSRMRLFFVLGAVQTLPVWVLADSGLVRNLIDESVYNRLPFKPPVKDPGDVGVIGGNGEALDLRGFIVLPISIGNTILWHELCVVPRLPLEVLVGADILAAHQCTLQYLKDNKKKLHFGLENCTTCCRFRNDPEVGPHDPASFR